MLILLAASPNEKFIEHPGYVKLSLEELDHKVETFDFRDFILPGVLRERFSFLQKWDIININKRLIQKINKLKPDLVFVIQGQTILPETILKIKKLKIPVINWYQDPLRDLKSTIESAKCYDFFFMPNFGFVKFFLQEGIKNIYWMPFACHPKIHKPVELTTEEKNKYKSDIAFVGSGYPFRIQLLENLVDFDLKIWGAGWNKIKNPKLAKHIQGSSLTPYEFVKVYSATSIGINCIRGYPFLADEFKNGNISFQNMRVFEILACNTFEIVDEKEDVLKLFENGKDLVCFKNPEELKNLVKYYLNHPLEAKKIAYSGYKKVIEKHTYTHRVKEILSYIH